MIRPDLAARRVILASYLYYERSSPLISDAKFDKLCDVVADDWDWLDPIRQWQLGSPEQIRASGHHIKLTRWGEHAAVAAYRRKFQSDPHGNLIEAERWRPSPLGCDWAPLGG